MRADKWIGKAGLVLVVVLSAMMQASAQSSGQTIVITNYVSPKYPEEALQLRTEGYVDFQATFERNGAVAHIMVVNSYPAGVFDDAVIDAVSQWRVTDQQYCDGALQKPFRMQQRINFKLADSPKPTSEQWAHALPDEMRNAVLATSRSRIDPLNPCRPKR